MSKKLDEIRIKIDTLDNQIHDLLMRRADLIHDISAEKQKHNKPIVHPAREAMMIRRLLGRHKGLLPQAAIVGIWRELVGAVCMLQRGLQVYVSAENNEEHCWDMAKNYFGSVLPMSRVMGPLAAIAQVRDHEDAIAVLPWPEDEMQNPWWAILANQDKKLTPNSRIRIVSALPYGSKEPFNKIHKKALVIGRLDYLDSGDDRSFLAIDIPQAMSRTKVIEILKKHDLETLSIFTKINEAQNVTSHLVEVTSYIGDDDKRLESINEDLESMNGKCVSLGGYPVPPVFRAGDTDPIKLDPKAT